VEIGVEIGVEKRLGDRQLHGLLLLAWIVIGTVVRFAYLNSKPPWTDEFSTLVFSLGHSFRTVPLDQVISTDTLLQPLQVAPFGTVQDVVQSLMSESTHPPVYFILSHWWLQLFPALPSGLVSLWAGRSLPALVGVFTIPAAFGLGWLAFGSRLVGQLAAGMMAISPYAVFLAQDARHYTLAILLATLSLACLVVVTRCVRDHVVIPLWLCLVWTIINGLGVGVHYFFALTLAAEAIALLYLWFDTEKHLRIQGKSQTLVSRIRNFRANVWRLAIVAIGSLIGCLIWVPELLESQGSELTQWIFFDRSNLLMWLNPFFQSLAAWVVMLCLLPLEADFIPLAVVAGMVMLPFLFWIVPLLGRGLKVQFRDPRNRWVIQLLGAFVLGAIALIFLITYISGRDLTRGARYNFVYFPAVIVLLGAALAVLWQMPILSRHSPSSRWFSLQNQFPKLGKNAVLFVLFLGLLSALSVATNLGYEKYYRPELVAAQMRQHSQAPMLVATNHQTHVNTGEMMGIAREFRLAADASPYTMPKFLLAHRETDPGQAIATVIEVLRHYPRPFDLWLINWEALRTEPAAVEQQGCPLASLKKAWINGYSYDLYRCR